MEWSNDLCLSLIDEYQKHPVLWDAKNNFYYSKTKKNQAWETISRCLKIEVMDVKNKMNSLLGSFRREKSKVRKCSGTGNATKEIYISKWFAFTRMQFLLDKNEPRGRLNMATANSHEEEEENIWGEEKINHQIKSEEIEFVNIVNPMDHLKNDDSFHQPSRPKKAKNVIKEDPRLEEPFSVLKDSAKPDDECSMFGQYIASKLRRYSPRTRALVEHSINNILFEADMGKLENFQTFSFQNLPSTSSDLQPSYYTRTPSPTTSSSSHQDP